MAKENMDTQICSTGMLASLWSTLGLPSYILLIISTNYKAQLMEMWLILQLLIVTLSVNL